MWVSHSIRGKGICAQHPSLQVGILDQWTQFLITDALIPENQVSSDVFAGSLANQTNLAIKGIVGIQAMAEIARVNGYNDKYANYSVSRLPFPTSF